MTDQQIQLLQHSFQLIIDRRDHLAEAFLVSLKKSLRKEQWPADSAAFCRNVMQTVAVCVRGIGRWDQLSTMLRDFGKSYLGGKLSSVDPDAVRLAFMGAVQECLEKSYTPDIGLVWNMWYDMVSGQILEGSGERVDRKSARSVQSLVRRARLN